MSTPQKNQRQKNTRQPIKQQETRSPESKPIIADEPSLPVYPGLIFFDKKVKLFLLILLVAYVGMSLLKLQTSSIGNWDLYLQNSTETVVAGTPKIIRMDEWLVMTPQVLGQYKNGMHLSEPSMGGGNAPLIWGLPVKDFTMILKPNLWGYFLFDIERAFAFSWNFNIFFFLGTTFLLLLLLTRNRFWIALFGTFFIFLSSGLQWWSYSIGTYMIYLNGMLLCFLYMLYGKKMLSLVTAGLLFVFSAYGFISNLYPAFQVPLVYLYALIFIGFLLQYKDFDTVKNKLAAKAGIFIASLAVFGFFAAHYYSLAKDTFDIMMNTAYPGKRVVNGGDLVSGKFFSEFMGLFLTETHLPQSWRNICEASGFIMFFPIIFYCIGYDYYKTKKLNRLLFMLSLFVLICSAYILLGFPPFLSRLTLFSMSTEYRMLPILELGNAILLICFLGNRSVVRSTKISWIEFGALAIGVIIFMFMVTSHINKATDNFFTDEEVKMAILLFTAVYLLIRYSNVKFALPALCVLLLGVNIANATIHPLTKGLDAIYENPIVKNTKKIHDADPKAGWAVFGNNHFANLLKANGINVLNGVKLVPDLKRLAPLDPIHKFDTVYNRYAHVSMKMFINWKDTISFFTPYPDGYDIIMDPCSPRLKPMGIKYILFTYRPRQEEVRCMTAVDTTALYIYKRNDQ